MEVERGALAGVLGDVEPWQTNLNKLMQHSPTMLKLSSTQYLGRRLPDDIEALHFSLDAFPRRTSTCISVQRLALLSFIVIA